MLMSMTGYGSGECTGDDLSVKVEIRGVNHRFLETVIRLPSGYLALEDQVRRQVAESVHRGRLEIFVSIKDFATRERTVILDSGLLASYRDAVAEAKRIVPITGTFDLTALLAIPDVFRVEDDAPDTESAWPYVSEALGQALQALVAMRRAEGERLQHDIVRRLDAFAAHLDVIESRSTDVVKDYENRLRQRLAEWHEDVSVNEDRMYAEIAFMAERSDITEELVRARSHVEAFKATCQQGGAVGRKLDFLLQELHREITTIGNKAADVTISRHVVEAKAEIEKIREQVQNIE